MGRTVSRLLNLTCGKLSMPFQSIQIYSPLSLRNSEKVGGGIEVLTRHRRLGKHSFDRQGKASNEKRRKEQKISAVSIRSPKLTKQDKLRARTTAPRNRTPSILVGLLQLLLILFLRLDKLLPPLLERLAIAAGDGAPVLVVRRHGRRLLERVVTVRIAGVGVRLRRRGGVGSSRCSSSSRRRGGRGLLLVVRVLGCECVSGYLFYFILLRG